MARHSARTMLSGSISRISTNCNDWILPTIFEETRGGEDFEKMKGKAAVLEAGSFPGSITDWAELVGTALAVLLLAIVGMVNSWI